MKKLLTSLMVLALALSVITFTPNAVQAKRFKQHLTANLKSISVSWSKVKGAQKYVIYRAKVKRSEETPKKSKFKKIKTVYKKKYTDKKVKKNKYYAYYVKAVKNGKVIKTTFNKDYMDNKCKGFERATIGNGGYGENYTNSRKKLYFYTDVGYNGYMPKKIKYVFYRKVKDSKSKYKKMYLKKTKDGFYYDNTVKAGNTYQYKCKAYVKKGKKKYYSKISKMLEIPAVNFHATYKIESLTKSGVYDQIELEAIFKVTKGDKYDGTTVFLNKISDEIDTGYYCYEKKDAPEKDQHRYSFQLTQYSTDGKTWTDIPDKGVELSTTMPLYLKAKIAITKDSKETSITFAGSDSKYYCSLIESNGNLLEYNGPGNGEGFANFDLVKGTGKSYQEWD